MGKKSVRRWKVGFLLLASSVKDISDVLSNSQIESNVLGVYRLLKGGTISKTAEGNGTAQRSWNRYQFHSGIK